MIPCIESGIPGFDELTSIRYMEPAEYRKIPLLYYMGLQKLGKTIFCNQFAYKGLFNREPCLYITTDLGIKQLEINMLEFLLPIEKFIDDNSLYMIDTITDISVMKLPIESETIIFSYKTIQQILWLRLVLQYNYIYKNNSRFRSVLDSSISLLGYNDYMLIIRVLKAYLMRINEFGGTSNNYIHRRFS